MNAATETSHHSAARGSGFSWVRALQVFAVLWACICVWDDIDNLARNAHLELDIGARGFQQSNGGGRLPGYVDVLTVTPDGPMDKAGVVAGDRVHYDNPVDFTRHPEVGEPTGMTIDHLGQRRHIVVTAWPRYHAGPPSWSFITDDMGNALSTLIMALFAGFIALRSRGKLTTILLALGLMTYGLCSPTPERSFSDPAIYVPAMCAGFINLGSIPVFFYAFALNFYKDSVAQPRRWAYALLGIYGVLQAVLTVCSIWFNLTLVALPLLGNGFDALSIVSIVGYLAAFAYLFLGWRRSRRDVQQRYALMLLGISAIIVAQALTEIAYYTSFASAEIQVVFGLIQSLLSGVVAPVLFAYAVFRHKVLDLGFAVNRTLVYTVISFVILLLFGLAEWGIEKLLPEESLKANALISAGIALCIFLVFHRIRDFVEHHVETLFFRKWHHKEAELKRFVREASFILTRGPLIAAYVAAVKTFGDGGEAALYLADDDGVFHRVSGGLAGQPETIDADSAFMVTLRADRAAFEPHAGEASADIALVLPMIHRTEVVGVTLLGSKSNGFGYRPDEKEVLAWAAHQIGQDLHALEVERLQAANSALVATVDTLSTKYNLLHDLTEGVLKEKA